MLEEIYRFLVIDVVREAVSSDDLPLILNLGRSGSLPVANFAVGGLLRRFIRLPEVRTYLLQYWEAHASKGRRHHVLFRLLDIEDLDEALRRKLWIFVRDNLDWLSREHAEWFGGPPAVLDSVRSRLGDAKFPDKKKWVYLCSVPGTSDRPALRILLQPFLSSAELLTVDVARHLMECISTR